MPEVLAPILKKRAEYKRRYQAGDAQAAAFKARADAHKWCLVTCVDGKTRLVYREGSEIKTGSIRDLIDRHARDKVNVVPLNRPVEVVSLDENGRATFRSVRQFVRQPAPPSLLRVRVGGGRNIDYTADHDCLILKRGRLIKRKADRLRVGDWIPVLPRLPSPENPPCHVDVFSVLLEKLPFKELPLWRVFGNRLGRAISENGGAIKKNIKGDYSPLSLRIWRCKDYLPFHLVNFLPKSYWAPTRVGRGKRSGGLLQKIPARLELNEGLGFFLGFYVGDGSVSGRMIRLDVGTAEKDIADFLVAFVRDQFHLNVHRYKEKGVAMEVLQINSIALIRVLEVVFGLGRASDPGKLVVPPLVLNGPREFRRGFLRGLLAADGHVSRMRNFVGWSSMSEELVEDLGALLGMEGLQFRFSSSVSSLSRVDVRGTTDVRELMSGGILSQKHAATMRGQPKRTAERRSEFPPQASGLLRLAQKARVARVAPRLTTMERISLQSARVKIEQIRRRLGRLSSGDVVEWDRVAKLVNSDVVYERVKSIQQVPPSGPYVYCVTMNQGPRAFCLQGGVLTGNCFGYLGYKNARFGKIEAHESVTAWGRETLLRAKDFVEGRGFHVLHANVDCVWIQGRPGLAYEKLRQEIETAGGCSVGLEGVYKWLRFCPSKTDPLSGVPNRYFGAFTNGELKIRGLALRRRDTPEIFKKMQKDMLAILAEADDVAGCRARVGRVSAIAEEVRERIAEGRVEAPELAITFTLSRDPSEYVSNGPSAVAAKRLAASGVRLHPGETVRYLITSSGDKVVDFRATPLAFVSEAPEVDTKKYLELWQRCRDEILDGLEEKPFVPVREDPAPYFSRRRKTEDEHQGHFSFVEK